MTDKRMIDFPQDVSDVLNVDCAELRSIYKDWRTEICNDAICSIGESSKLLESGTL